MSKQAAQDKADKFGRMIEKLVDDNDLILDIVDDQIELVAQVENNEGVVMFAYTVVHSSEDQ